MQTSIRNRVIKTKSRLPELIAETLAEFVFCDTHAYLVDFSPRGFTVLEVNRQSGFIYSDRFITSIKSEIIAPFDKADKVVLR